MFAMSSTTGARCASGLFLLLGVWQLAGAGLIYAKAWLAPKLMEHAYAQTAYTGDPVKPWPWADTYPMAELVIPRISLRELVLAGDSGNALAFGPGMALNSRPGEPGLTMVSAHRDTHFRRLGELEPNALIELNHGGAAYTYRVQTAVVADAREGLVPASLPDEGLLLVTCYPFDALLPGGPLRYVVVAERIPSGTSTL